MRRPLLLLLGCVAFLSHAEAAKPPKQLSWAMEIVSGEYTPPPGAPVLVLLDEATVTPLHVDRVRYRRRFLAKILTSAGRDEAFQPIHYSKDNRLAGFRAWTIRPDGSVTELDRSRVVDYGLSDYKEFSDSRARLLRLDNVGVGSAVAVEYVLEQDQLFLQELWPFQWTDPVLTSRFILENPKGWDYKATFLNTAPFEPEIQKDRVIWEMTNLPGLQGGGLASPPRSVAPTLALSYYPRVGRGQGRSFDDWLDVASWYDELAAPQATADDPIRQTVSTLIESAPDRWEQIEALGRYVQQLRYITITLGLSSHRPHPSPDVFRNRYGDCKDKATLLKTMLREAGIESHLVLVYTRTAGKVFPEFPSMTQFNHVILAVEVPDDIDIGSSTLHPELGRLLLFDPTDEMTPVGDLPWSDQGTTGLLVHSEHGALIDLPALPAETNHAEREWTLTIDARGGAAVELNATFRGQYARLIRYRFSGEDDAAQIRHLSGSLGRRVPGAVVSKVSFEGLGNPMAPVRLTASVEVPQFGSAAGKLRLIEVMGFLDTLVPTLPEDPGGLPVQLAFHFSESDRIRLVLPSGWQVSEPPEGDEVESVLGRFSVSFQEDDDGWTVQRSVRLEALEIPLDRYDDARSFLGRAAGLTATTLVLDSSL
jgi:transglutaminase-like putative cysteine protease